MKNLNKETMIGTKFTEGGLEYEVKVNANTFLIATEVNAERDNHEEVISHTAMKIILI